MKDKVMQFIIGGLVGAIIATGVFYIYTTTTNSCDCNSNNTQMNGGQPPEMPNGQNGGNGQPPEIPSGQNGEKGQPPAKPGENNTQNDSQNNN